MNESDIEMPQMLFCELIMLSPDAQVVYLIQVDIYYGL